MKAMAIPVVHRSLKLFLFNLKKSTEVDCSTPRFIKGIRKIIAFPKRLIRPLSSGVKNFGFVNIGIKRKDNPFEKKFENV
jgi:hypothetical protein